MSFVILGLTGLNITFGKIVLLPLIGPDAFSNVSQAAKYVHNFTSFSFVAGLVLIIVIFFRDNLPEKVDLDWVKQGGGFIKNKHAPAGRFNLGEKAGLLAFACWPALPSRRRAFCCCFLSMEPTSPTCRSRRQCTPSWPFCSSP